MSQPAGKGLILLANILNLGKRNLLCSLISEPEVPPAEQATALHLEAEMRCLSRNGTNRCFGKLGWRKGEVLFPSGKQRVPFLDEIFLWIPKSWLTGGNGSYPFTR